MQKLGQKHPAKRNAPAPSHRREYERRVNRVIDHIQAHLADELTLEQLAAVAAFSPFHFHRVFAAITGETLSDFIRRIRLERAASALALLRETSVLEIALRCGFSSAATFARAFKGTFGMSATEWRDGGARQWGEARRRQSKQGKAKSNPGQAQRNRGKASLGPTGQDRSVRSKGVAMPVKTREIPPYRVAYMRHVGPYGEGGRIGALWMSFERWIRTRDLRRAGTLTIGIGHDAPNISAPEKLRYDACLVVDASFKPDRFVNIADLPGGKYAVAPFEGTPAEINGAWSWLWTVWLPSSGYQPRDRPCLELRHDFETTSVHGQLRCELCLPIGPL
jgi:AraC family transcriptional regulator